MGVVVVGGIIYRPTEQTVVGLGRGSVARSAID